jgi:hypothetical protein
MYTGIAEVEVYHKKVREVLFYKKILNADMKEENTNIKKMIRMMVGSHFKYSPIPPHTPASILSVLDFLSLAGILINNLGVSNPFQRLHTSG